MITRYTIPVALVLLDPIRLCSASMLILAALFIIISYTVCQLMVKTRQSYMKYTIRKIHLYCQSIKGSLDEKYVRQGNITNNDVFI